MHTFTVSEDTLTAGGVAIDAQVPSDDGLHIVNITDWTQTCFFYFLGLTRCEALADKSPDCGRGGLREAVLPTGMGSVQCSLGPQPVWGQEQLCEGNSSSSAPRLHTQPLPGEDTAMQTHIFVCENGDELPGDKVLHKLLERTQNLLKLILCCDCLRCRTNE